jgi:hypothetical protein
MSCKQCGCDSCQLIYKGTLSGCLKCLNCGKVYRERSWKGIIQEETETSEKVGE